MNLINFESRDVLKAQLKEQLAPTTKSKSIKLIHVASLLDTVMKDLKKDAYAFLSNRCADCAEHIDEETGLKVTLVEPNKKVYNKTEELEELEKQKKEIEAKIKAARDAAGFTLEEGTSYWKATGK